MHSESVTTEPGDDSGAAAMAVGGAPAVNFQRPVVSDAAAERAIALYRTMKRITASSSHSSTAARSAFTGSNAEKSESAVTDPDKIQQVLANLLSNAVKLTPAGGQVRVDWDATAEHVRIHVRDTGPGIPSTKLEAIFEPFVQLGGSLTRVTEGAGLGLAISRELSRAMGGDVTVESELGSGSTFTVTLPRPAHAGSA